MKTIDNIYNPYNFSATRCYVIELLINVNGYVKIEKKLPAFISKLKGVFISVSCKPNPNRLAGFIMLSFNSNALKCIQLPIERTTLLKDCSKPMAFDEEIKANSLMQGYYYDATGNATTNPYTLCIYLHYNPTQK